MAISTISVVNDDALINNFLISIPEYPNALDITGTNFRVTNVSIPEQTIGTYDVHYRTQVLKKYSGKLETPNEFSFDFRVDKFWQVYKGFSDWMRLILDPVTGTQVPDFENGQSGIRVPISVITVDSNDAVTSTGWTFDGCFPSSITGVDFAMDTGEPVIATVTMQFITMNPFA